MGGAGRQGGREVRAPGCRAGGVTGRRPASAARPEISSQLPPLPPGSRLLAALPPPSCAPQRPGGLLCKRRCGFHPALPGPRGPERAQRGSRGRTAAHRACARPRGSRQRPGRRAGERPKGGGGGWPPPAAAGSASGARRLPGRGGGGVAAIIRPRQALRLF